MALLMISAATAVPTENSKYITKTNKIEEAKIGIEEKIENVNLLDLDLNGPPDWLLELLKAILQFVLTILQSVLELLEIIFDIVPVKQNMLT